LYSHGLKNYYLNWRQHIDKTQAEMIPKMTLAYSPRRRRKHRDLEVGETTSNIGTHFKALSRYERLKKTYIYS